MERIELIKVFTGSESSVLLPKNRLEEIGIEYIVKNDSPDAFLGTTPLSTDLYIKKSDIPKAKTIVHSFGTDH